MVKQDQLVLQDLQVHKDLLGIQDQEVLLGQLGQLVLQDLEDIKVFKD
jgi:hypothetical protein